MIRWTARTHAEAEALAALRIGGSYEDAMRASGLPLEHVMRLLPMAPFKPEPRRCTR